jgi:hypothetical protein
MPFHSIVLLSNENAPYNLAGQNKVLASSTSSCFVGQFMSSCTLSVCSLFTQLSSLNFASKTWKAAKDQVSFGLYTDNSCA